MARRLCVLLVAAALSLGILLGLGVAPARADSLTLPAEDGWRVCVGQTGELTIRAAAVRSEGGAQFANGEVLVVTVAGVADDEVGGDLSVTLTDDQIVLPDDWEALPQGTETDDAIELGLRLTATDVRTGSALIELAIEGYEDGIAMTLHVEVRDCPPPPLGTCGNLVPDVVAVGDTLTFLYPFVDLEEPAPHLVFTGEEGAEVVVSGGLSADLSWDAAVEITEEWIGRWSVAMYVGAELLCSEQFLVSAPAPTPSPGPTTRPVASRTPAATLPPTDADGRPARGVVPVLVVLTVIAAVASFVGAGRIATTRRR